MSVKGDAPPKRRRYTTTNHSCSRMRRISEIEHNICDGGSIARIMALGGYAIGGKFTAFRYETMIACLDLG